MNPAQRSSRSRTLCWLSAALHAAALVACGSDDAGAADADALSVIWSTEGLQTALYGEPFSVEARIVDAEGQPARDYEFRWSINSDGHREEPAEATDKAELGVESLNIVPTSIDTFEVFAQVGVREADGKVSWRSHLGPTLAVWSGEPYGLSTPFESINLAVGETRAIFGIGVAKAMHVGREVFVQSHHEVGYTSENEDVVAVDAAGVLTAKQAGATRIRLAYAGFERHVDIVVDADAVMAAPGVVPAPIDIPMYGIGSTDSKGFPQAFAASGVAPFDELESALQRFSLVLVGRWTGSGAGVETVSRPQDTVSSEGRMLRGSDGRLWVSYRSEFPTPRIVVASRPLDDGPSTWSYEDLVFDELNTARDGNFDYDADYQMITRPAGGVWIATGGAGTLANSDGEVDHCARFVGLATVTRESADVEELLFEPYDAVRGASGLLCQEPNDARVTDAYWISIDEAGHPAVHGTSPPKGPPTRIVFDPDLNDWKEVGSSEGNPATLVTDWLDPSDWQGKSEEAITDLPASAFADVNMGARYAFFIGGSANFFDGNVITQWSYLPDGTFAAFRDIIPWQLADELDAPGWSVGVQKVFAVSDVVFDATPPTAPDPRQGTVATEAGAWIGDEAYGPPLALSNGRILQRLRDIDRDMFQWTSISSRGQTVSGEFQNNLLDILGEADGELWARVNSAVYYSLDAGLEWFQADEVDIPPTLTEMRDGLDRRHTLTTQASGANEALVWEVWDGENLVHSHTFVQERGAFACIDPAIEKRQLITREGNLIVCMTSPIVAGLGWALTIGTAELGSDTLDKHVIGLAALRHDPIDPRWQFDITQLENGNVAVGFTGVDPQTKISHAIVVEQTDEGFGAPVYVRAGGDYVQRFGGFSPLPSGGIAALVYDKTYVLRGVTDFTGDEQLRARWNAVLP